MRSGSINVSRDPHHHGAAPSTESRDWLFAVLDTAFSGRPQQVLAYLGRGTAHLGQTCCIILICSASFPAAFHPDRQRWISCRPEFLSPGGSALALIAAYLSRRAKPPGELRETGGGTASVILASWRIATEKKNSRFAESCSPSLRAKCLLLPKDCLAENAHTCCDTTTLLSPVRPRQDDSDRNPAPLSLARTVAGHVDEPLRNRMPPPLPEQNLRRERHCTRLFPQPRHTIPIAQPSAAQFT